MERWETRKKYIILFALLWVAQMAAAFYFCTQKQGFHEDEYYTYYSTARTNGFYVEDGQWMERDTYRNEFVVLPDQRFQYGLVRLVQSWDVHPPLYYWVFHTASSFVPDVFSKWIGLSVNLLFHGLNIFLVAYLAYAVGGRNGGFALCAAAFWGAGPAVMSGVVFIRMYEMLTTFVLLCAILHVRAVCGGRKKLSATSLAAMAVVTYLGFLTQYYYLVFLCFIGAAFCVWILRSGKRTGGCVRYGLCQGAALALAWATYPACLGQMFRGQRGAQATENFLDLSNTAERIAFFADLMNRYVFGHFLPLFAALIAAYAAVVLYEALAGRARGRVGGKIAVSRTESGYGAGFWLLVSAAAGYFLTVSKTALLLGDTSNRYQLPIYGIVVILVLAVLRSCLQAAASLQKKRRVTVRAAAVLTSLVCILAVLTAYRQEGVLFLYPEAREETEFADGFGLRGTPVVWLYRPGEEWCVWDVTDELLRYPKVYFAAADSVEPIADREIREAECVIVYLARGADEEEQLGRILAANPGLTSRTHVFQEKYCDVWVLSGIL